ncbi:hypothetical protein KDA11_05220 [Candidatus Saccharibacteria bacterium]|nr:hypothetical protein [Candidatus Saccharibacteria bacterium]
MQEISKQQYNSPDTLLISRRVYGGRKIVASAIEIGRHLFGDQPAGFIEIPNLQQSAKFGMSVNTLTPVTLPSVKVVDPDELILKMFERSAPRNQNFNGKFNYATNKLISDTQSIYRSKSREEDESGVRYRPSGLYETLTRIGLDYDVFDQSDIPIKIGGLINTSTDTKPDGATQLSLSLHPTHLMTKMIIQQADICRSGLARQSVKVGYPYAPHQIHIPLCTLPGDASLTQESEFINQMLPLVIGAELRAGGVDMTVS